MENVKNVKRKLPSSKWWLKKTMMTLSSQLPRGSTKSEFQVPWLLFPECQPWRRSLEELRPKVCTCRVSLGPPASSVSVLLSSEAFLITNWKELIYFNVHSRGPLPSPPHSSASYLPALIYGTHSPPAAQGQGLKPVLLYLPCALQAPGTEWTPRRCLNEGVVERMNEWMNEQRNCQTKEQSELWFWFIETLPTFSSLHFSHDLEESTFRRKLSEHLKACLWMAELVFCGGKFLLLTSFKDSLMIPFF